MNITRIKRRFLAKEDVDVGVEEPLVTLVLMSSLDVVTISSIFDSH